MKWAVARLTVRRWPTALALIGAVITGTFGSGGTVASWSEAMHLAASNALLTWAPLALLTTTLSYTLDNDLHVTRDRLLAGLSPVRWWWARMATTLAINASGLTIYCLVAAAATNRGGTSPAPNPGWGIWLWLGIVLLSLTSWAGWLGARTTAPQATALIAATAIGHIASRFFPGAPGRALRLTIPTAALETMSPLPGAFVPVVVRGLAAAVVVAATAAACISGPAVDRGGVRLHPADTPRRRPAYGRNSLVAFSFALVGLVAAGFVLPTAVTKDLPVNFRPSYRFQRMTGSAPEQVARRFTIALVTQPQLADRLTVAGSAQRTLGPYMTTLAAQASSVSFILIASPDSSHALVRSSGQGQPVSLCMVRRSGHWVVLKVPVMEQC